VTTPPLYNRDILALAVALAEYPRLPGAALHGERRAPLCGSRVAMDLDIAADGAVRAVGLSVEACALGQAAASLFARGAAARDAAAFDTAHRSLAAWLAGSGTVAPDWPGIALLEPARAYPARHGAILLPFALAAELTAAQGQEAAA
jgi:NifU-like protein involved in Fe-S cluster formation